jgi:hypothetical protein
MLGWIALDPREVRAIAQKVASPGSLGTVDELGLGVVTDALANVLFPAFTTLMTRARYFCLLRGVVECAARHAAQKMHRQLDDDSHRDRAQRMYRKHAEECVEAIEVALAYALVKQALRSDKDPEGVLGNRNLRSQLGRRLSQRSIPHRLFGRQERYPSALYFAAARKLGAFAVDVRSRDDMWRAYLSVYTSGDGSGPFDSKWASDTQEATRLVKRLYEGMERQRSGGDSESWWRGAGLSLTAREARLLSNRLGGLGGPQAIPKAVMQAFLATSDLPEGIDGYRAALRVCKQKPARLALQAAIAAMQAIEPPLAIYRALREGISPSRSSVQRQAVALAAFKGLRSAKLVAARRSCALLIAWEKKSATLIPNRDMRHALRWLHGWLSAATIASSDEERLECVRAVLTREHWVLSRPARRKRPRFIARDFSLTSRGKADYRKQSVPADEADETEPLEARVSAGRLHRATQIFDDIRHGLRSKA